MFAIVEIGGKQYKITEDETIRVEMVDPSTCKVLLVSDGKTTQIGTPYLDNATVGLEVTHTGKDKKVIMFKMKSKKRYRRLRGHRQPFNEMKVGKISA
ncbi:50S ribosomal protein L21 [Candidatus Peregrinibacteria bacterium CG_4_9_14_0_2_um_filter_53_11]|nr:MAG: 50S ribosomal protein L21 [Candidatus Peregrinibacteria bacterium CG_4_9_14_0_2_um_filter_53_11]